MSGENPHPPLVPVLGGTPPKPSGPLRTLRCVRHAEREAVGRCPSCGGSFCRECVSEHEGRLLCALCLSREIAAKQSVVEKRDWGRAKRFSATMLSVLVLWLFFFLLGELLVKIPSDFHEGKIWGAASNQPP